MSLGSMRQGGAELPHSHTLCVTATPANLDGNVPNSYCNITLYNENGNTSQFGWDCAQFILQYHLLLCK